MVSLLPNEFANNLAIARFNSSRHEKLSLHDRPDVSMVPGPGVAVGNVDALYPHFIHGTGRTGRGDE